MAVLPAILVIGAVVLAVAFIAESNAWIRLDEQKVVPVEAAGLQGPLRQLLASVPRGELLESGHGTFTLTVRRRPIWLVVVIVCTLPLGLLLLSVKDAGALMVALVPAGARTEVRIVGRTTPSVQRLLDDALAVPTRTTTDARG